MKTLFIINIFIFAIGLTLWMMDDPYMPEAKLLGSAYGKKIMKISFIIFFICLIYS